MNEEWKVTLTRKAKRKNARPMLTKQLAGGLERLAMQVNITDDAEMVKAAKYCLALAEFLKSDEYAERSKANSEKTKHYKAK